MSCWLPPGSLPTWAPLSPGLGPPLLPQPLPHLDLALLPPASYVGEGASGSSGPTPPALTMTPVMPSERPAHTEGVGHGQSHTPLPLQVG